METCQVHYLEMIGYQQAWEMQKEFAAQIAAGERPATLLLLQHPHVYTFGSRGEADSPGAAATIWHQPGRV